MDHDKYIETLSHDDLLQHARDQHVFADHLGDDCNLKAERIKALTAELAQARAERDAAQAAHVAMHKAYGHVTGLVPFDPASELKQLRASNHYMIEELTRLRAKQSGQQAGE